MGLIKVIDCFEEPKLDMNPFLPLHSDRSRISDDVDKYRNQVDNGYKSIEQLISEHEEQDEELAKNPYSSLKLARGSKMMPNYLARKVQKRFKTISRFFESYQLSEPMKLFYITNTLNEQCKRGLFGLEDLKGFNRDEIICSLYLDSYVLRKKIQIMTNEVFDWVDKAITLLNEHKNENEDYLIDGLDFTTGSDPLMGILALSDVVDEDNLLSKRDIIDTLKGMVAFGYADDFNTRSEVIDFFPYCVDGVNKFKLGGGMFLPFNMKKLDCHPYELGVCAENVGQFIEEGKISFDPRKEEHPETKNYYIKFIDENGFSDIGGMLLLKQNHGVMGVIGGMISDSLDSIKSNIYDPFYGALPLYLSHYIETNYSIFTDMEIMSDDEKKDFVYLGAMDNHQKLRSSQPNNKFYRGVNNVINSLLFDSINKGVKLREFFSFGSKTNNLEKYSKIVDKRMTKYKSPMYYENVF